MLLRVLKKHSTELSTLRQKFAQTISRMRESHTQLRENSYTQLPLLYDFIETKDTLLCNFISLGLVRILTLQRL
jgi:hypothetical protein